MYQPTCSNIAVPFSETVCASDASTLNGGLVSTRVPLETSKMFWRSAEKKARNPKLPSRTAALIQQYEDDPEDFGSDSHLEGEVPDVGRPIGLRYDFIEVCGGAGVVTKCLVALDVVCGPIFDISSSRKYDITNHRVFAWLAFILERWPAETFLAAPPFTAFSPAAQAWHPRVLHGNSLAFASMGLMVVGKRTGVFSMLEAPRP